MSLFNCALSAHRCCFGSGRLLVQMTHTHAGPSMTRPFVDGAKCPGGEIAMAWWQRMKGAATQVAVEALAQLAPSWVNSAVGRCDLAQQQEYLDRGVNDFVSTYNPDFTGPVDETLLAVRVTRDDVRGDGIVVATLCNYGCHPQSLGPENSLVSADWPGTTRELLERELGGTSLFLLGACGETGPIEQKQADTNVTERLGRKVGFAALSALEGLRAPAVELRYSGPIVSGAVIGLWPPHAYEPEVSSPALVSSSA